jgi:opacity protein-like surface antigen
MFAFLFLAVPSLAQQWEMGADIGYGAYRNGSIYSPGGAATAGIRNRFTAGAVVCEDRFEHFSGEIRYQYQDGHPFLSSGAVSKDIQGQSHTFTYDVLFHLKPRTAKIRPYFAAGPGAKYYEIAGPAPQPQPLPSIAVLTRIGEWKFAASLGAGVKIRVRGHILLRCDFRDYFTQFPKRQIAPAANGTARGIFQQFTPMFGASYIF